jgi:hypothetical protein
MTHTRPREEEEEEEHMAAAHHHNAGRRVGAWVYQADRACAEVLFTSAAWHGVLEFAWVFPGRQAWVCHILIVWREDKKVLGSCIPNSEST